ncbi:succinylglutamate desuccinylase/aspartoacylase family protein [Spirulina subsalsa FACHB-351]|uniref:Succinylglutamate desuccinylase/aspartoacylase family protein n=1 Tax=Spirulina subsalsa FACHB-351 TaxID=234711 RepID=A0ABT3LB82_9CYAN|nr:succinylglutamate desuccinylase/aspartoacylase family protein [Spirulina subsalsa]MCW6038349.1 succinylglutamate desuccinylase/aspartoacylase family protein [Spirulina subsalsa FACHB-351]
MTKPPLPYPQAFQFQPKKRYRVDIPVAHLPTQTPISLPVTIIHGREPGAILWLSAAIHGDEINGVEIIRQVVQRIQPQQLRGTLIAVPVVNVFGFIEQNRYLPDRRDLNRCFPGSANGSLTSRLAHLFMREIVTRSTHGIDLHTASDHRVNLPQIRANLEDPETYRCAKAFGAPVMLHSTTRDGSLREAAGKRGIPILLYEAGEAMRFDLESIRIGVEGIMRVMTVLEMCSPIALTPPPQPLECRQSKWVRAARSGILRLDVKLGERVDQKQVLGTISDAFGDKSVRVRATVGGVVIGFTQNPLVNQGDGILHLAVIVEN